MKLFQPLLAGRFLAPNFSKKSIRFVFGSLAFLVLSLHASAYSPISSQLDMGDKNDDVTSLQQFLSSMPSIYPSGLVTGYYGTLTKDAINRFQAFYGLPQVGRVGPLTRDKINSLITGGTTVGMSMNPIISPVSQYITPTTATFSWNTDRNTTAKVFYYTNPITMNEGDINSVGFGSTNGYIATNNGSYGTSQQVILNNLTPNTVYYYVPVATDTSGNVSVVGPNFTFRTSP